jgi:hypothetical protein
MDYTQKIEDCYRVYMWTEPNLVKSYVCGVYMPNYGLSLLWDNYVMELKEQGHFIEEYKDYDKSRKSRDFKNTVMCQIEEWVDSIIDLYPVFKKFGRRRQNVMLLRNSLEEINLCQDKLSLILFTDSERAGDGLLNKLSMISLNSEFNMILVYSGLEARDLVLL